MWLFAQVVYHPPKGTVVECLPPALLLNVCSIVSIISSTSLSFGIDVFLIRQPARAGVLCQ